MTSTRHAQLLARIESREALIGIIGLGYVGLPLALRFAQCGLKVLGFDVDPAKIDKLAAGQSYINYLPAGQIVAATAKLIVDTRGQYREAAGNLVRA